MLLLTALALIACPRLYCVRIKRNRLHNLRVGRVVLNARDDADPTATRLWNKLTQLTTSNLISRTGNAPGNTTRPIFAPTAFAAAAFLRRLKRIV